MAKRYKIVTKEWHPSHDLYAKAQKAGDYLPYVDIDILEGTTSDIVARLRTLEKYAPGPLTFKVNMGHDYDEIRMYYERKETDKEREARLARARKLREKKAAVAAKKEEQERALLAKLKDKYGE